MFYLDLAVLSSDGQGTRHTMLAVWAVRMRSGIRMRWRPVMLTVSKYFQLHTVGLNTAFL
jgi:hypothetical protein